jgi:hypothetical protein
LRVLSGHAGAIVAEPRETGQEMTRRNATRSCRVAVDGREKVGYSKSMEAQALRRRYGRAGARRLQWKPTTGGYQARTARGTWFIDDTERPDTYVLDWYSATQPAGGVQIGRFTTLLDARAKAEDLAWHDRRPHGGGR